MAIKIVIVEGPSGAGKTTWIKNQQHSEGWSSIIAQTFSNSRLPENPLHSGLNALRNDTSKLISALITSIEHPNLEVIYIDRCIASQMVYHQLRVAHGEQLKLIRFSVAEVRTRLMGMLSYINLLLPQYLSPGYNLAAEFGHHYHIEMKVILPEWSIVKERRAISGREYPAGEKDYELYSLLFRNHDLDFPIMLGDFVL